MSPTTLLSSTLSSKPTNFHRNCTLHLQLIEIPKTLNNDNTYDMNKEILPSIRLHGTRSLPFLPFVKQFSACFHPPLCLLSIYNHVPRLCQSIALLSSLDFISIHFSYILILSPSTTNNISNYIIFPYPSSNHPIDLIMPTTGHHATKHNL